MSKLLYISLCTLLSSCTYNVSMAHTEGTASDVVDSEQTSKANPSISVPVQSSDSGQSVTLPVEK